MLVYMFVQAGADRVYPQEGPTKRDTEGLLAKDGQGNDFKRYLALTIGPTGVIAIEAPDSLCDLMRLWLRKKRLLVHALLSCGIYSGISL